MTILTNARRNFLTCKDAKYLPSSPILMDFFAHAGFECGAFWYKGTVTGPKGALFTAQSKRFCESATVVEEHDGLPMEQLKQVQAFLDKNPGKNLHLLLNNRGSHFFYTDFDLANSPFKPERYPVATDSPKNNPKVQQLFHDAYDSTVHYTDEYIRRLIEMLKGRPFVYVYVSDHGEYLGKEGYWHRGEAPESEFFNGGASRVPFFIITSPEFVRLNPNAQKAIENLRNNTGKLTGHEHVFHTVMGIIGMKSAWYDASLDLTTPDAQPYDGPGAPAGKAN